MSLQQSTRVHSRELVSIKEKGKLLIPYKIIKRIDYLHKQIKSIEWSSILIYDVVSGSVEDPSSLVLRVKDFILMDIGSAAYTEYNFTTEDEYAFDRFTDALENSSKLGHLHTHHSMNCFFSGTDIGELHDNAPNHNFYLSLIVNFDNIDKWCAAVAVCADEETSGEIMVKRTWKGTNGYEVKDIPTTISSKKELLYKIDLILEAEDVENEFTGLEARIAEIRTKKASIATNNHYHSNYYYPGNGNIGYQDKTGTTNRTFDWDKDIKNNKKPTKADKLNGVVKGLTKKEKKRLEKEENHQEIRELDFGDVKPLRARDCYSPAKVRSVLLEIVGGDKESQFLSDAFDKLIGSKLVERQCIYIADRFDVLMDRHFKFEGEAIDYHCIASSFLDIISSHKSVSKYQEITKLLTDSIDLWVDEDIKEETTSYYTGIPILKDSKTIITSEGSEGDEYDFSGFYGH